MDSGQATIVVTGSARGGTSFVASVLGNLGIEMGRGAPRYENPWLQKAFTAGDMRAVGLYVDCLNAQWPVWGWKLPALSDRLSEIDAILRRPRYILVFRDPVATTTHKLTKSIQNADERRIIRQVLRESQRMMRMIDFVGLTRSPVLMLSHEKAVSDPAATVSLVAKFCGSPATDLDGIVAAVGRDSRSYSDAGSVQSHKPSAWGPMDHALWAVAEEHGLPLASRRGHPKAQ